MSGYIGTQPVPQATQTRDSFTATSGQTSFATGGYTPNFLDIFLNGVKLAAADYTASNGSDVVLASGASTGDILEVVAYTAFDTANVTGATNFTVTGAFTSQGIDDNGNATALTIDSSENVLIGKASADGTGSTGHDIRATGLAYHTVDGGDVKVLNRLNSDGGILSFRKDGTTVGSIAASGGDLLIGTGDTGIRFVDAENTLVPFNTNGSGRDNAISLGKSVERFKDLYLSGGVYLGGTGTANKLDDYEEGTWTPKFGDNSTNISTVGIATYQKIGRNVSIQCDVTAQSYTGANAQFLKGLPFPGITGVGTGGGCVGFSTSTAQPAFHVTGNDTALYFVSFNTGDTALSISGIRLIFAFTYETTS